MKKSTLWQIAAIPLKIICPVMYRARLSKYLSEERGISRTVVLKDLK